jgi:hypothetical protein
VAGYHGTKRPSLRETGDEEQHAANRPATITELFDEYNAYLFRVRSLASDTVNMRRLYLNRAATLLSTGTTRELSLSAHQVGRGVPTEPSLCGQPPLCAMPHHIIQAELRRSELPPHDIVRNRCYWLLLRLALQAGTVPGEFHLRDLDVFRKFALVGNTIEWKNGADFAPEFLYEIGTLTPENAPRKVAEDRPAYGHRDGKTTG